MLQLSIPASAFLCHYPLSSDFFQAERSTIPIESTHKISKKTERDHCRRTRFKLVKTRFGAEGISPSTLLPESLVEEEDRRPKDFQPPRSHEVPLPFSNLKMAAMSRTVCSSKDYVDQMIGSRTRPRLCLLDHGQQIKAFLSKSLARVWQAQVARIHV
jgi:hypothetical protein